MSRKTARENLLKLIFEFLFTGEKNEDTFRLAVSNAGPDETRYIDSMYQGIIARYEELKKPIELYSRDFAFGRIYKVDLSIMLIAAYEILFVPEIPFQVSINEAVELAKVYSTEKSSSYINGILASLLRDKGEQIYAGKDIGREANCLRD